MTPPSPQEDRDARLTLDRLLPGQEARIEQVGGEPAVRTRLRDLGFREGAEVFMVKQAPLADPVEYRILGGHVSLRRAEARLILVTDVRPGSRCPHRRGRRHRRRLGWWRRGRRIDG